MNTLIKWPGGKSREYKKIKDIVPTNINTYIEPFFGGGGIYFKLEPNKSIINDINENLMLLYQLLKEQNSEFRDTLIQIADDWDNLAIIAKQVHDDTKKYKYNISDKEIINEIAQLSENKSLPRLINGQEKFWTLLGKDLINKLNRIKKLEVKNGKFNSKDYYEQIVAVTKGTYYYYLRDKYSPTTPVEKAARFFFIREYCFGSMFRFNKEGKFNIPYGGASYNDKSFHAKIDKSFSNRAHNLLENTELHCEDFRTFFKSISSKMSENDFCFFDPPYDTEFSEYDKHAFGKKDQEDLARIFGALKCKALMIIKRTDFIYDIYKNQQDINDKINIDQYGKNYSYNVRGRNEREVTHLLITNYESKKKNVQLSLSERHASSVHV